MSKTFEEYDKDFKSALSRVRRHLAGTRSRTTLHQCEDLLQEARRAAAGMVGLAELEGAPAKIREAQLRIEREIRPLDQEITAALKKYSDVSYQAPTDLEAAIAPPAFSTSPTTSMDTQRLIAYSDELLRDSQALCDASEQIGHSTLHRMSSQREQLETARQSLDHTQELTGRARQVLQDMRNKGLRNKAVLYTLIFLLIVANGYVIYKLYIKK